MPTAGEIDDWPLLSLAKIAVYWGLLRLDPQGTADCQLGFHFKRVVFVRQPL